MGIVISAKIIYNINKHNAPTNIIVRVSNDSWSRKTATSAGYSGLYNYNPGLELAIYRSNRVLEILCRFWNSIIFVYKHNVSEIQHKGVDEKRHLLSVLVCFVYFLVRETIQFM